MKYEFQGQQYMLVFRYNSRVQTKTRSVRRGNVRTETTVHTTVIQTEANILAKRPNADGWIETGAHAGAICSKYDQFSKAWGRRIALGRLLKQLGDEEASVVSAAYQQHIRDQQAKSAEALNRRRGSAA